MYCQSNKLFIVPCVGAPNERGLLLGRQWDKKGHPDRGVSPENWADETIGKMGVVATWSSQVWSIISGAYQTVDIALSQFQVQVRRLYTQPSPSAVGAVPQRDALTVCRRT